MIHMLLIPLIQQNLFAKTYAFGNSAYDDERVSAAVQMPDNGFTVVASSDSGPIMFKTRSDGSVEWARVSYPHLGESNSPRSLVGTSDSGFMFTVDITDNNFGALHYDILAVKTDSMGSVQWAKMFSDSLYEQVSSVVQTRDGGYACAGYTDSFTPHNNDILVLKMDANGVLQWAKVYSGSSGERANQIIQTSDGGYAVVGWSGSFTGGSENWILLKLGPDGSVEWCKLFGSDLHDYAYSVVETPDHGYAITGQAEHLVPGQQGWDVMLLKVDSQGVVQWAKSYGWEHSDDAYDLTQTADGGYAVFGHSWISSSSQEDLFLLRTDQNGDLRWARSFGETDREWATSMLQTLDKGFLMYGSTDGFGVNGRDMLMVKVDSAGNYPDCVSECLPEQETPLFLDTVSATIDVHDWAPDTSTVNLQLEPISISATDICLPLTVAQQTGDSRVNKAITCVPGAGFVLFMSQERAGITVYRADGGLAYRGLLKKGKNPVALERGVYFWQSGQQKGKAVVR